MSKSIAFQSSLQEVDVNGKRTITINPTDEGFLEDLYGLLEDLEQIHKDNAVPDDAGIKEKFAASRKREQEQRAAVDAIFGEGFCADVFGTARLYSISDGLTLIENFLYAVLDYMDEDLKKQQAARSAKIAKYTAKYRKGRKH